MALITAFAFGGMDNVSDAAGVGVPEATSRNPVYSQCVDIVNCTVDNDLRAVSRDGSSLITAANVTSGWSNGTESFCVTNLLLHTFDGANLNPIGNSPAMLAAVEFCQVNDVTAFSDVNTIGVLQDGIPYTITTPAEAEDILDLETWVKLTYPAGAAEPASNFELDAFKVATYAGRCLEFFNGALYLAASLTVDERTIHFVFCTKTFNIEKMDIRYNVVAGFASPVTMIKGTNDGLLIGTEKGAYFLEGDGVKGSGPDVRGFEQRQILPFPVIYNSAVGVSGDKAAPLGMGDKAAVFLTPDGIYAAGAGGKYKNLSENRVTIPTGTYVAAMVQQHGTAWHYIVSIDSSTLAANIGNGAHSRFTSYAYKAFFQYASLWYGVNASGVFLLSGDDDNGTDIDAYTLSPDADFGDPRQKTCDSVYAQVRTDGEMQLDLYVDGVEIATELPFVGPPAVTTGIRRMRAKLPMGAKGTHWQYKLSNVEGARFTAFSLTATPTLAQRTG
jgi:hypothetical protein